MTTSSATLLDDLYEQFTDIAERAGADGSSSPFTHGFRSGLARARLFVLDAQAGEFSRMV